MPFGVRSGPRGSHPPGVCCWLVLVVVGLVGDTGWMVLDRRMARLRARHARESRDRYREFLRLHPAVEDDQAHGLWVGFTADLAESQRKERDELATVLRAEHGYPPALR